MGYRGHLVVDEDKIKGGRTTVFEKNEDSQNPQDESYVTDAMNNKIMPSLFHPKGFSVPVTNEKKGAERQTFPTQKSQKEIVGHHSDQEKAYGKICYEKETNITRIVPHRLDGIDENETGESCNQKH